VLAAGVLRRRPVHGSVLPEPTPREVYEGRLPQVVGENLLDVPLGRAKGRLVPAEIDLRDPAQATAAGGAQ
jgi:hypothetical protein